MITTITLVVFSASTYKCAPVYVWCVGGGGGRVTFVILHLALYNVRTKQYTHAGESTINRGSTRLHPGKMFKLFCKKFYHFYVCTSGIHTLSSSSGTINTCTPCPRGMTTRTRGARTSRACVNFQNMWSWNRHRYWQQESQD